MMFLNIVGPALDLHRVSLKDVKTRNFNVMRWNLEIAPQTTKFYNIYPENYDLLNPYKGPSIFLGFHTLWSMTKYFCVKSLVRWRKYVCCYIVFLNFLNMNFNNQWLLENHPLAAPNGIQAPLQPVKSDIISIVIADSALMTLCIAISSLTMMLMTCTCVNKDYYCC